MKSHKDNIRVKEAERTSIRVSRKTRQRLNRAAARKEMKRNRHVSLDEHLNELQDLEDNKSRGPKVRGSID